MSDDLVARPGHMNKNLRDHVTRVGFNLSLARTHIAALVHLNESMERHIDARKVSLPPSPLRHLFNLPGMHGLIDRGLVIHHFNKRAQKNFLKPEWQGMKHHYTITRAGELAIELLREAGLYDEYRSALGLEKTA